MKGYDSISEQKELHKEYSLVFVNKKEAEAHFIFIFNLTMEHETEGVLIVLFLCLTMDQLLFNKCCM